MSTETEKVGSQILSSRVKSGIPGLDPLVDGGFPAGKVVLILGEPGTGKTILCSRYLHWGAAQTDDKGVYVGMNPRIVPESIPQSVDWANDAELIMIESFWKMVRTLSRCGMCRK